MHRKNLQNGVPKVAILSLLGNRNFINSRSLYSNWNNDIKGRNTPKRLSSLQPPSYLPQSMHYGAIPEMAHAESTRAH